MPKSPWVWEADTHRYRNTETGQFIGQAGMLRLRDQFMETALERMREHAGKLAGGDLDVNGWQAQMRREIRAMLIDEYVLGRGGRAQMTASDWGMLGRLAREQYAYLHVFALDIERGRYTDDEGHLRPGPIGSRAELYMKAGLYSYERGHVKSYGIPELPYYPGQGTECKTNCRCHWDIKPIDEGWIVTWMAMGDHGTCFTCQGRAAEWDQRRIYATPEAE